MEDTYRAKYVQPWLYDTSTYTIEKGIYTTLKLIETSFGIFFLDQLILFSFVFVYERIFYVKNK